MCIDPDSILLTVPEVHIHIFAPGVFKFNVSPYIELKSIKIADYTAGQGSKMGETVSYLTKINYLELQVWSSACYYVTQVAIHNEINLILLA